MRMHLGVALLLRSKRQPLEISAIIKRYFFKSDRRWQIMVQVKTLRAARLVLIAIALFSAGSAMADKPGRGDGGRPDKHQQKEQHQRKEKYKQEEHRSKHDGWQGSYDQRSYHDRDRLKYSGGWYFGDRHRAAIRDYYDHQYRSGHCPPGLAKKHNGCMPPGQAKKWVMTSLA